MAARERKREPAPANRGGHLWSRGRKTEARLIARVGRLCSLDQLINLRLES